MDYSDAAGTLLLNIREKAWSKEVAEKTGINLSLCPLLVESFEQTGKVKEDLVRGLDGVKVYAGVANLV